MAFVPLPPQKGFPNPLLTGLNRDGYRHLFASGSSDASLNPVNYAHYRFEVHGHHYHSLTRIADAGLDYSQRTNKIVHHGL
ncbi:MAG: hypothetical protein R3C28_31840 [Pirellulaceae bacterium]